MVKVSGRPAIYAVNKYLKIMYFPEMSLKAGIKPKVTADYITINEECFDSLPAPIAFPEVLILDLVRML